MTQVGGGACGGRRLVMHVEDDPVVLAAMRMLLGAEGYDVLSASDAPAALQAIETGKAAPDLLVVDYHLGRDMSGTEVAERIATLLGYPIPVILLTADPANAEVPWLTRAPVWLLPKPPDMRLLVTGIASLTQFSRDARAPRAPAAPGRVTASET